MLLLLQIVHYELVLMMMMITVAYLLLSSGCRCGRYSRRFDELLSGGGVLKRRARVDAHIVARYELARVVVWAIYRVRVERVMMKLLLIELLLLMELLLLRFVRVEIIRVRVGRRH